MQSLQTIATVSAACQTTTTTTTAEAIATAIGSSSRDQPRGTRSDQGLPDNMDTRLLCSVNSSSANGAACCNPNIPRCHIDLIATTTRKTVEDAAAALPNVPCIAKPKSTTVWSEVKALQYSKKNCIQIATMPCCAEVPNDAAASGDHLADTSNVGESLKTIVAQNNIHSAAAASLEKISQFKNMILTQVKEEADVLKKIQTAKKANELLKTLQKLPTTSDRLTTLPKKLPTISKKPMQLPTLHALSNISVKLPTLSTKLPTASKKMTSTKSAISTDQLPTISKKLRTFEAKWPSAATKLSTKYATKLPTATAALPATAAEFPNSSKKLATKLAAKSQTTTKPSIKLLTKPTELRTKLSTASTKLPITSSSNIKRATSLHFPYKLACPVDVSDQLCEQNFEFVIEEKRSSWYKNVQQTKAIRSSLQQAASAAILHRKKSSSLANMQHLSCNTFQCAHCGRIADKSSTIAEQREEKFKAHKISSAAISTKCELLSFPKGKNSASKMKSFTKTSSTPSIFSGDSKQQVRNTAIRCLLEMGSKKNSNKELNVVISNCAANQAENHQKTAKRKRSPKTQQYLRQKTQHQSSQQQSSQQHSSHQKSFQQLSAQQQSSQQCDAQQQLQQTQQQSSQQQSSQKKSSQKQSSQKKSSQKQSTQQQPTQKQSSQQQSSPQCAVLQQQQQQLQQTDNYFDYVTYKNLMQQLSELRFMSQFKNWQGDADQQLAEKEQNIKQQINNLLQPNLPSSEINVYTERNLKYAYSGHLKVEDSYDGPSTSRHAAEHHCRTAPRMIAHLIKHDENVVSPSQFNTNSKISLPSSNISVFFNPNYKDCIPRISCGKNYNYLLNEYGVEVIAPSSSRIHFENCCADDHKTLMSQKSDSSF